MAVFLLRRAAFVIPERLPVPAQVSEWGHLRHEVPQALRPSRSAVQQALIGRTYQTPEVSRPGSFLILLLFIREITPHERSDCIDRFAHMSRSDKNMPRAVYLLQDRIFINLLRPA